MTRHFRGAAASLAALLLAALLPAATGCKRQEVRTAETIEEAPRLASTVHTGDPASANQLTSGFYDVEAHAWRWTEKQFAVTLRPPVHAAQQGAVLELHLTVPRPSIAKLGTIALSASIGGAALPPETYTRAGDYTYRRPVPASLLAGDAVRIDFQLDKALPPGDVDKRELGVVVSSVGLVAQ
jgi:hypothetical protein